MSTFVYRRVVLTALCAICPATVFSQSSQPDEAENDGIRLTIECSVDCISGSGMPSSGRLTLSVYNGTETSIQVPTDYDGRTIQLLAKGVSNDKATRWPLVLFPQPRQKETQFRTIRAGKSVVIGELPIADIFRLPVSTTAVQCTRDRGCSKHKDTRRCGRTAMKTSAFATRAATCDWTWDWPAASRPPVTPLLSPNGVADKLELRAQLRIGPRRVLSDLTTIRVLHEQNSEDPGAAPTQLDSDQ